MENDNTKRRKFQHLDLGQREEIAILLEMGLSRAEIARRLEFHRSTIGREIKRNNPKQYKVKYRGNRAQQRADKRKRDSRQKERLKLPEIKEYVIEKLKDEWSPEQISGKITIDHPGWKINHESIYQFIYAEKQELISMLRQGRKRRRKKGQAKNKRGVRIPNRTMISERPESIYKREEYGDWEADTMVSRKSKVCIMGVVERKSGYCILEKLANKTADEMDRGLRESLGKIPDSLLKSITYDNGTENAKHEKTNNHLGTKSYFCNPYHSWEKGSVENMFGLLRQYLPKGSDLDNISEHDLKVIQDRLNNRPRKRFGYRCPAEIFCNLVA